MVYAANLFSVQFSSPSEAMFSIDGRFPNGVVPWLRSPLRKRPKVCCRHTPFGIVRKASANFQMPAPLTAALAAPVAVLVAETREFRWREAEHARVQRRAIAAAGQPALSAEALHVGEAGQRQQAAPHRGAAARLHFTAVVGVELDRPSRLGARPLGRRRQRRMSSDCPYKHTHRHTVSHPTCTAHLLTH